MYWVINIDVHLLYLYSPSVEMKGTLLYKDSKCQSVIQEQGKIMRIAIGCSNTLQTFEYMKITIWVYVPKESEHLLFLWKLNSDFYSRDQKGNSLFMACSVFPIRLCHCFFRLQFYIAIM